MPAPAWVLRAAAAASFAALASCGGSGNPSTPTSPTASTPTASSSPNAWSVAGQIVSTVGARPVGGAQVAPGWSLAAVTADGQGQYQLSDTSVPPRNPFPLTVSASGYVSHDVWLGWQHGPETGVQLDVIRDAPPFSMDFYRQLVRGTYDEDGAPWPVLRWNDSPKVYVRTVDQNGRAIEPEVLAVIKDALRRSVPAFTGGRLTLADLELGTEVRAPADGWINIDIKRDPNERQTCGFSNVGSDPGAITLNDDVCSCGSNKIPGAVVLHEMGHALGFFHVSDRRSVMYPFIAGDCPAGELSAAESYHSAIAYARPRGNTDPDKDPSPGASMRMPTIRLR